MKIEDQVCTLEQAKRLKELGVSCNSVWCHINRIDDNDNVIPNESTVYLRDYAYENVRMWLWLHHNYPAFTVAELGMMCPYAMNIYYSDHLGCWNWQLVEFTEENKPVVWAAGDAEYETEVHARADCLIYSIDNNYITIEEVNQRL